jgi:hypothetical protein
VALLEPAGIATVVAVGPPELFEKAPVGEEEPSDTALPPAGAASGLPAPSSNWTVMGPRLAPPTGPATGGVVKASRKKVLTAKLVMPELAR